MKNNLETRLGYFVVLAAFAVVFILEMLGGFDRFRTGKHVSALFNDAHELHIGDRVKMAGVEVGTVDDIKLDPQNNKVKVILKLNKDAAAKTDSTATIKFAGLMGQNFVSIDFGSPGSPAIDEGAVLNTTEMADISSIMQKLDGVAGNVENITKTFSGDKLDNILGPMTDFMKQNSGPLTMTIANIKAISADVADGKGTIGRFIQDPALYNSAMDTMSNLQVTIANAQRMVAGINNGEGTIGHLMKDPTLYVQATGSMTNLNQILQKINQGQGSVGKLVNDQEFYKNAKLTLQKVDKATEGLEDSGPLSVLGMAVNSLF
jgi:phospholipid/cholesterol/gamma-HCH transport system substrate-binding protein